jgi:hypothetical protein
MARPLIHLPFTTPVNRAFTTLLNRTVTTPNGFRDPAQFINSDSPFAWGHEATS